ncbi:MAG: DUF971 domain-containing protein [Myxococcota bacterium]
MTIPPEPIEIRAPEGARMMEIRWDDGVTTHHPHRILRAFCPCAICQGHTGRIVYTESVDALPDSALEIRDLATSGSYALRLTWGDGHNTGIYTFRYLRELAPLWEATNDEVRTATFGR